MMGTLRIQDAVNAALSQITPPNLPAVSPRQIVRSATLAVIRFDRVRDLSGQIFGSVEQRVALLLDREHLFNEGNPAAEPKHPLLRDVDELGPDQERELACTVAVLWDEFLSDIGGPVAFAARSAAEQADYVCGLRQAAHQVRINARPEKLHYALAPEMMASYAEVLAKAEHSVQERELAATVARLATRGHLLRKTARDLRSGPMLEKKTGHVAPRLS